MEKFAGYGFNRSHSAAYGLLTYQTAYLKHYYPVEFFAALLTCDKDDTDAVVKFIAEAKASGIAVLRPDVNESDTDFSVVQLPKIAKPGQDDLAPETVETEGAIRFGLGAVKGVGEGAVEVIKQPRAMTAGTFQSLFDFCSGVDGRKVNRKVIEALVKSGAFDGVARQNGAHQPGPPVRRHRPRQRARRRGAARRESGQTSLLALFGGGGGGARTTGAANGRRQVPEAEEWMPQELLAFEKEALGFYISGHPLDRFASEIRRFTNATAANCIEKGERAEVILAGVVVDYQERTDEDGQRQVRLLHAGRPARSDRLHRQLEEARRLPRRVDARRAAAGHRHGRRAVRRRRGHARAAALHRRQAC